MGKPKRVLGVLAVLKQSQVHLVDHLRCACGDSGGPLVMLVSQKVEDDLGIHRMDQRPVDAVLQGEGGSHSLSVGHRARDSPKSAARATLVACPQGPLPDALGEVCPQAS